MSVSIRHPIILWRDGHLCITLLSPGNFVVLGQQAEQQHAAAAEEAPEISNDQLDSLVAPIALYPDPLLGQTLAASNYPLA